LADYQQSLDQFSAHDAHLLALSVDSREDTRTLVDEQALSFPVGWGVDARVFSRHTGAFYHREKGFLHATGFLLDSDGQVLVAVYSSGPIGRLVAADCLGLIEHLAKQQ
jgi:peroxiredoxin